MNILDLFRGRHVHVTAHSPEDLAEKIRQAREENPDAVQISGSYEHRGSYGSGRTTTVTITRMHVFAKYQQ